MVIKTRADFISVLDKLSKNLELYEGSPLKNNSYRLFLANGEDIYFTFADNNIPHILGVTVDRLKKLPICSKESSYDALIELIENEFSAYNYLEKYKAFTAIFSSFIDDKNEIFQQQFEVPLPNKIEFICKYDRSKTYTSKEDDGLTADYFICRKTDDGDLLILGLVKQNEDANSNRYCVQTSRVIKNDDKFNESLLDFIHNQEITYATGLHVRNDKTYYEKNSHLNIVETYKILESIKSYASIAGAIPHTLVGHMYNLNTLSKNRKQSYEVDSIMARVLSSVINKEIITLDDYEEGLLSDAVLSLINSHNNYMLDISDGEITSSEQFTRIKEERDTYRADLETTMAKLAEMKEIKEKLEQETAEKEEKITDLEECKKEYDQIIDIVTRSVNRTAK